MIGSIDIHPDTGQLYARAQRYGDAGAVILTVSERAVYPHLAIHLRTMAACTAYATAITDARHYIAACSASSKAERFSEDGLRGLLAGLRLDIERVELDIEDGSVTVTGEADRQWDMIWHSLQRVRRDLTDAAELSRVPSSARGPSYTEVARKYT